MGKLTVAKGFKKLPKVQYFPQSGHTEADPIMLSEQLVTQLGKDVGRVASVGNKIERFRFGNLLLRYCTYYNAAVKLTSI